MNIQTTNNNEHMLGRNEDFLNKVWSDPAYRAKLEDDPKAALAEMGGEIPDGLEIKVVSDTDRVKYLHIPSAPPEGEIFDEDLMGAVHGGSLPISPTPLLTVVGVSVISIVVTITAA